jgi:hypothetical protein
LKFSYQHPVSTRSLALDGLVLPMKCPWGPKVAKKRTCDRVREVSRHCNGPVAGALVLKRLFAW